MVKQVDPIMPSLTSKEMMARSYLEPTGPATDPINVAAFSAQAAASVERMTAFKHKMDGQVGVRATSDRKRVLERCK